MSFYYQDQVSIIKVDYDNMNREEVVSDTFDSIAYVEQDDRIQLGTDGQPTEPRQKVFLPFDVNVDKGDYIQVLKIIGKAVKEQRRKVISVYPAGSLRGSHLEVSIGGGGSSR